MNVLKSLTVLLLLSIALPVVAAAQSNIPDEYRGSEDWIARGVLNGNEILTNFRNHGELSRWGDIPWGVWREDVGGPHLDGVGFVMAAEVDGERAKWPQFFGEDASDTTLTPVIINFREVGKRLSPYNGNIWGWLPLNGFHNPERTDPSSGGNITIPAISTDETSWPDFWPDRFNQDDSGWESYWNGFRGKGLVTGAQETFYVMDDFSDKEYHIEKDEETGELRSNSHIGVYYPSSSDSSMGGLGTQVEVRTFQVNDVLSADMLFTQYRTTNVSEKDLDRVWTSVYIDSGLGLGHDDNLEFIPEQNLLIFWDENGEGVSSNDGPNYDLGYMGFLLLEHSTVETNGVDQDQDGIIDESKFNGPGTLIEGKSAIDEYLSQNYNMELFEKKYQDLSEFPAYAAEKWWTGDEDLDWVAFEDLNNNGHHDSGEVFLDVGRDGLGPNDPNYEGPDEGEGDGMPTQGEPNFGEQDMLEAENKNLTILHVRPNDIYVENAGLRDDRWVFERLMNGRIDPNDDYSEPLVTNDGPLVFAGVGPYSLKAKTSSYFTTVLIFAEDREQLLENAKVAQLIYESDYGQSKLITGNESPKSIPADISLSQNYPNPFNPSTTIRFSLPQTSEVSLKVYDIAGREVMSLMNENRLASGQHSLQMDASHLASGIYVLRLTADGVALTKKLTLIK